ncbi:MAG: hypothetical protein DMF93_15130, partial [Acidobacteria bacterium]
MHREVRGLDAEHRARLRGNRLVPREAFAEHHRLTREDDRRPIGIHGVAIASDAVAGRIDRVLDRPPADDAAAGARRREPPAEPRVGTALGLFVGDEPARRTQMDALQHDFAGRERQRGREGGAADRSRRSPRNARETRARDDRQQETDEGDAGANGRLDAHVPRARQEEGRQEVLVEPALRRRERRRDQRDADDRRHRLDDRAVRRASSATGGAERGRGRIHDPHGVLGSALSTWLRRAAPRS